MWNISFLKYAVPSFEVASRDDFIRYFAYGESSVCTAYK